MISAKIHFFTLCHQVNNQVHALESSKWSPIVTLHQLLFRERRK